MIATIVSSFLLFAPASPVTVRVDGEGYLRFLRDGRLVFAKDAKLVVRGGKLAHWDGPLVTPNVALAEGQDFTIGLDGTILSAGRDVGRLVLAIFPDDIRPIESQGFLVAAERPQLANPGEGIAGVIRTEGKAEMPKSPPVEESRDETPVASPKTVAGGVAPPTEAFLKAGGVQIVIDDMTEVEGDTIRLGEIATIYANSELAPKLAAIEISQTPPFGVNRIIDRSLLTARIRAAGLDPAKYVIVGSAQAKVTRPGQTVAHDDFVKAAIDASITKFGRNVTPQAKSQVNPLAVPKGSLELVAERISQSGSVVTVVVAALVDGKRINSRTISLVAAETAAPSFRPGDTVNVRVRSGAIVVETTGRVKSVDPIAGTVTVVTETGATKIGILGNDGFVEVLA